MNNEPSPIARWLGVALAVALSQLDWAQAQTIANSTNEFSGVQGQDGWFHGYRNVTADGKGIDYDADADFLPFEASMWTGSAWDLDSSGGAPWTTLEPKFAHPNGVNNGAEHWAIRRWVPSELTSPTWVSVFWHVSKPHLSGGVTAALHVNGVRVQSIATAGQEGNGRDYFVRLNPTDKLDLILSPVGPTGDTGDASDGSDIWMLIELQPDTDDDDLPDAWENLRFPGDLTRLSATGDFDSDGVTDGTEMLRGTDPLNPDDHPRALVIVTPTGAAVNPDQGQCTFRWSSQAGVRYTVMRSTNLTDWTPIRSVDSAGTETSFTDDLGLPAPTVRFYRVSQP